MVSLVLLRQWMQYIAGNISSWRNQSSQLEHARSITRHTGPRASIRLNFEWLHQSGLSTTRINYGQRGVLQLFMSKASYEILTVSSSAQRYTQSNSSRSSPGQTRRPCDWHLSDARKPGSIQKAGSLAYHRKSSCDDVSILASRREKLNTLP